MILWNEAASSAVRCMPNEPAMASSWSVVGDFTDMVIGPPSWRTRLRKRGRHHAPERPAGKAGIAAVVGPAGRRYDRRRPTARRISPRKSPDVPDQCVEGTVPDRWPSLWRLAQCLQPDRRRADGARRL